MEIKRIAVLGTGVMGGQIAAHAANSNIKVYAFDISQDVAEKGVEAASTIKPNAFSMNSSPFQPYGLRNDQ